MPSFVVDGEAVTTADRLPVLPLRDVVVFPYVVMPLLVGRAASLAALKNMALHYSAGEALAKAAGSDDLFYPAKNCISAELRLAFLQRRTPVLADTV